MKKIFFLLIILVCQLSCTSKIDGLKEKLNIYKECYKDKDFIKMSSLVLPSIVQEAGGPDKFVELMNNIPGFFESLGINVDVSTLQFGEPSKIYEISNYSVAVVPTKLPIAVQSQKGYIKSSVICFSEDNGRTWFFIEGSDEGRIAIANTNPEIIQTITIPTPKLIVGGKVFHQRNGEWYDGGVNLGNTPPDFVDFMDDFTSNKEFQLAGIKFPLSNSDVEKPAPSKDAWTFVERKLFFEGEQNDEGSVISGHFETLKSNQIRYVVGYLESDVIFSMIFEKNNDKWMLVDYYDSDMFAEI
jgi:hypothetical protein